MDFEAILDRDSKFESLLGDGVEEKDPFEKVLGEIKPATEAPAPEPKPQSILDIQMKGVKASLGMSKEEFDVLETEMFSQENKDSFMESVGEVATLAGQPYDVAKGAGSFIMAGIPTFILGVGGAVSEMNKELPQLIAGHSNLLDMADAAERGFVKVSEYMQPGKEKVEGFLELPRKAFKGAFGDTLSELLLGCPEDVDPELVGEIAMVPMTVAEAPFMAAAESEKIKTVAKVAKKLWLDKVFVTEDNIRGALKFAGFFAGLAGLHKVYRGKPGEVKGVERSVIKDVKDVAEKAEKIAETEMLVDQSLEGAVKVAQKKILEMEKQQLELEAKKIAEDIKKNADIEKVVKEELREKGKEVEDVKSGLRTAEERQAEIEKVFEEEKVIEITKPKKVQVPFKKGDVLIDTQGTINVEGIPVNHYTENTLTLYDNLYRKTGGIIHSGKGKPDILSGIKDYVESVGGKEALREFNRGYNYLENVEGLDNGLREMSALEFVKGKGLLREGRLEIESGDIIKFPTIKKKAKHPKIEPEPITELDRQTGVSIPELEGEKSPFFQTKEKAETMAKVYEGRNIVDVEVATQKLINDVNRSYHGDKSIDINKVRNDLSEFATRADEFNFTFDNPADFRAWKETVSEAAEWARKIEPLRLKIERRGEIEAFRGEVSPWNPEIGHEAASEGVGLYVTRDIKLAEGFGEVKKVVYKKPKKPLNVIDEELPIMHESDILFEPIKSTDSVWIRANKEATKRAKVTDTDWRPGDIAVELTNVLKEQGYDAVNIDSAGKWTVILDKSLISKTKSGIKLYTGIPVDKATKAIIEGAKIAKEYMDDARKMKRIKTIKENYEEFIREFVDKSGNIKWDFIDYMGFKGYETVQKLVLTKGANTIAANKLKQMQKEVYAGLRTSERHVLDNLVMYTRLLDIAKAKTVKEFNWPIHKKSGKQLTPSIAISYIETFPQMEGISPKRAEIIRNRVDGYFEWMKKPLKDMLEAELISQTEYDDLIKHKYRRIELVDIFDKEYESKVGRKPLTVYDSGVQELARGRKTDIYEPSSEIMALEVFNRSYGRIARQEANKALLDLSVSDPKNPFVRSYVEGETGIPSGWQRIFVFDKGKRKALYISPKMSKEWLASSSELPYKYGRIIQWLSGTALLRTLATGIEWGFALANLPKDIMHIYYAARVWEDGQWKSAYSPHLPIFLPQIGMDIARVFPDVVVRGKKTQKYFDYGGGMEFLVHQGLMLRKGKHLEPGLAKHLKILSWFGETSELTTRVALKERVIRRRAKEQGLTVEEARKNKDIQREASFVARDYMDFGQGGGMTKAADNALPYLNAAVQATRGLWRTAKDNPKEFVYKTAEIGLATTLVYSAMREQCPETAKALQGSMDLQNNLCIPAGDNFAFEDERGQKRYWGFKIPLDPGQKFFKAFFDAAYDKSMGYEVDIDRITNNMLELSPVGVSSMPPTVSAAIGYLYNKDLWRNEDVWKKTKPFTYPRSKEELIPGKTSEFFIDVGKYTGISPERGQHAAEELVTSNSTWAYLMGKGYEKLFADVPKEKVEQQWAEAFTKKQKINAMGKIITSLKKAPIIGRFIFVTNPYSKHAKKIEEEEEVHVLERWVQNRELDRLTDGYLFEKAYKREDVVKYYKSFKDPDTRKRLRERFDFQVDIKNLPERSFWLRLRGLAPEIRASRYYDRLKNASPKEHEQLMKEKRTVTKAGGFFTDSFWSELRKIRREKE